MKRRNPSSLALIGLVVLVSGCDYQAKKKKVYSTQITSGPLPSTSGDLRGPNRP